MQRGEHAVWTLVVAALAPCLAGCADLAGIEERKVALVTLARDQAKPVAVALDADAVYWINKGDGQGGALRKQLKSSPAIIDLLEPSREEPYALALDATHIYWSSRDTSDPESCGGTGLTPDTLLKLPKEGPAPAAGGTQLWDGCGVVAAIALNSTQVHGARPIANRITWVSKDGAKEGSYDAGNGEPTGVAADENNVYWTDPALGQIVVAETRGSEGKVLVGELSGDSAPGKLVLDEDNLYWLNKNSVMRYPRSPSAGERPTALFDRLEAPGGLAAHGDYLYATDSGAGFVYRIYKKGGVDTVWIAQNQDVPMGIAADDTGVYWANSGSDSGAIVRFDPD